MAFLSSESLIDRHEGVEEHNYIIGGFDECHVRHGAYELTVGDEYYVTTDETKSRLNSTMSGQQVSIDPGQFAMLITDEIIRLPTDLLGLISLRSRFKTRGLINVSGFHVDPGYSGRLKFSVYNAGTKTIALDSATRAFSIWLAKLDSPTDDPYDRSTEDNYCITANDVTRLNGELASPAELRKDIEGLRGSFQTARNVAIGGLAIIIAIFMPILVFYLNLIFEIF